MITQCKCGGYNKKYKIYLIVVVTQRMLCFRVDHHKEISQVSIERASTRALRMMTEKNLTEISKN